MLDCDERAVMYRRMDGNGGNGRNFEAPYGKNSPTTICKKISPALRLDWPGIEEMIYCCMGPGSTGGR